jgi:hypothetical protein
MSNYQNEREEFWENLLENMERMRERYNRQGAWSLEDCEKVDWIDDNIDYCHDMLEWCYYRDVEDWKWEDWSSTQDLLEQQPQTHPILGHPSQYLAQQ